MIILGFFLGFILILQLFVLVGICRTNNKLNELDSKVSTLNDLIVPAIGAYTKSISYIADQLTDISTGTKKKHEKKKGSNAEKKKREKKKGAKFL